MKALHMVAFLLTVVGALNWGLVGAFNTNLVEKLLGAGSTAERVVYILVGVSALILVVNHKKECTVCGK